MKNVPIIGFTILLRFFFFNLILWLLSAMSGTASKVMRCRNTILNFYDNKTVMSNHSQRDKPHVVTYFITF